MSYPLGLLNRLTRSLINRASRRQHENAAGRDSDSARKLSSGAPLIFETLEPRLLLAADPLGLVAAYAFDEGMGATANDSSSQFNTATLTNGVAWAVGQHGSAVSFDGVNDYISIPNSASTNIAGNAITLSMWINPQPLAGGDSVVIGKFWNTTMSSPYYQYGLELGGGNRTDFYVGTTSGPLGAIGGATLPFNQWSYLAITFDGAQVRTYVNGDLVTTQALSATITARGNPINIGADASPAQFNKGMLDDLRIYNSVLTQAQIQTDMAAPVGSTTPPPPDTTPPAVSLTPPAPILAGTVNLAATASDNVGVVGVKFLDAGVTIGSEDTTSPYGVSWNTTTATNGTHTLTAQARDAADNSATSTAITVTVDNQPPTGSVVINAGAAATNSTAVMLALTATDAVTSVTQMRFSNNGTSFSTAEAFAQTKAWTLSTGAGTKTVYVQFRDAAGNWSTSVTDTIVLDTTAPTISGRTATNITGSSAQITWATNEPATSRVEYGLTTNYGSLTSLDATLVTAHNVALTGLTPNTTYNYRVISSDAAGNQRVSANSTFKTAAAPDTIPPTVQSINRVGTTPTNAASVSWTVLFSESVTGVNASDFALVTTTGATITTVSGSGSQYTVTANTGTGNGTLGLNLVDNDTIVDTSNNPLGGNFTGQSYTIDKTQPSVTINQAAGQADPTSASPINFTVTFSETVTGFTASDISFANSTAGGTLTAAVTGTGPTYNVAVSGMTGTGNVVVSVPAGAATDAAGNASLASSTSTDNTVMFTSIDIIPPTVQSINRVGTTPTNAASVSWTVLFSESVTGVNASDFALVTTTGATITTVSGSGSQYTVTANTGTGNGTLGLNLVDNDTIVDTSNNPLGGNFTGQSYTIDKTQPSVTINQAAGQADPTSASPINFTVTFSETVTGFTASDISFANSTAGGTLTAAVTGTGPTYNVAVSGMTGTGNVVVSVPAGAATDAAGNASLASSTSTDNTVTYNTSSASGFRNEILATNLNLPTSMAFLPDGGMLVGELGGRIRLLAPPYTQPEPTAFLQLSNVGRNSNEQGLYAIAVDPNFENNHYFYVYYTLGTPNQDRLSRFTANETHTGTVPGSELVLFQDPGTSNADHHGGGIAFGNDGKIYLATGDNLDPASSQDLTSPRGKILRINPDGTVPTDNPFHDGAGPNYDAIWALGLRNPFRIHYDGPTGRLFIGEVGGNFTSTATEELNIGAPRANFGWPDVEGPDGPQGYTDPVYSYHHNGRDAAIVAGFVYRGTQFPSTYQGSFFFADYAQNWIRRLTFDANGNVSGVFNFEPLDGSVDGPYGDIVQLIEGPDGALYYLDMGFEDWGGEFTLSKIRRISYVDTNLPPVAAASATTPTAGLPPLTVSFSSAGSSDPEGGSLNYSWNFGDGATSIAPNPMHTYTSAGSYQARLTVSDGVNFTLSPSLNISVGTPPVITNLSTNPLAGGFFTAGQVISFSATATDEGVPLPASAYTWNIDFLHGGHVHPGQPITGTTNGTFTIPTSGHDFNGDTRYRITLTVTDSSGLQSSSSATVFPQKVDLTFEAPPGLTLYVDGIAHAAPFVYDTLVGFNHTIEARNQTVGTTTYNFASWSDGGAQQHAISVPTSAQTYTATYTAITNPLPSGLVAGWSFNEASGTSAADSSGNGNTATLINGVTHTAGSSGGGLRFDGTNDYIAVPNSPSLDISGTGLTLTMWINPAAGGGDSVVLGKFWNTTMTAPYYQYGLELAGGTTPNFQVGTTSGVLSASMGSALAINTWSHLAVVFNGSQVQFFVNGILLTTAPLPATITARGNSLQVGADNNISQFFNGSLDEVRIYNHALTAQEVQNDRTIAGGADTIAPSVTINQAAGQADPTSASPINFTVTFSETVTGFTASDISFANSTAGGTLTAAVTGTGPTYNVAVSGMTGTGNVVVSVPAGAATDAAGNASLASSTSTDNTVMFTSIDTIPPTVQSINRVGTTPTNAASVSWTVLFSESVTGVNASDFALVTTTGATITTVSGSGSQYTVTANTGTGNGTLGLNLVDNDTIVDTSNNPLGGNFTGQSYTIDKTQPSVTINQAAGQADPTSASPINFTVTFSETVTGFTASDISFANSTAGGTLTAAVTGTGPTYNVAVSGMTGTGNVVVSVPAGAATDAAGNASLASSTSTDNTVTYNAVAPTPIAFMQVNAATPQTNQSAVTVAYTSAQIAGDTNILAIGWNNTTSNITSVIDSAGNTYQMAGTTARGSGLSQAIYYASNIRAAAAGTNTVTVTFDTSTPFIDIRALEYSGLDPVNPFDVGTFASGNGTSANSGAVTTSASAELIFGAGMTGGVFSAAGTNFTNRIITAQDGDIAEDRFVTTAGSYSATASLSGSASWLMQIATFRAAT